MNNLLHDTNAIGLLKINKPIAFVSLSIELTDIEDAKFGDYLCHFYYNVVGSTRIECSI